MSCVAARVVAWAPCSVRVSLQHYSRFIVLTSPIDTVAFVDSQHILGNGPANRAKICQALCENTLLPASLHDALVSEPRMRP